MAKTEKKAEPSAKTPVDQKAPAAAEAVKTPAAVEVSVVKEAKAPKAAAKKAAAKTTAKAKPAAKKTAKAASNVKVFVEYQGRQMELNAILEAVKAASGRKRVRSLEVYVKPEDGAAYYVVNGKDTGKAIL